MPTDLILDDREGGSKSDMEDFTGSCSSLSEQVRWAIKQRHHRRDSHRSLIWLCPLVVWVMAPCCLTWWEFPIFPSITLPPTSSLSPCRMRHGYGSPMNVPPLLWEHQAVACLRWAPETTVATQVRTETHRHGENTVWVRETLALHRKKKMQHLQLIHTQPVMWWWQYSVTMPSRKIKTKNDTYNGCEKKEDV